MDDLADTAAPTIDSARFRQVLGHFCSGIVIITGMDGDDAVGLTCQSFSSVSLEPPLILFCPATTSSSWPRIRNSGAFAVNILSSEQEDVCRLFATKGADKFRGVGWEAAATGSPIIRDVLAWMDCRIEVEHDAGDHTIVVGRVVELHVEDEPDGPLLFYRGGYGRFEP
jgi:3-hydroxy-9,10-secoandrosta-1,3,5(10)-triene-9,17-dione monooxygenase reductase component